jgi:vancomycin resistance protein VanW
MSKNSGNKFYQTELNLRPKKRSRLRVTMGKILFTMKRYIEWKINNKSFSRKSQNGLLSHLHVTHATPLYRPLVKVDDWLQENKIVNLKIASQKINNVIINPGETFSFWKLVGKPTTSKGYKEGMQLFYGTILPGVGGGLCQLTNLLFWMFLHTPLTITERHRHTFDVFPDTNRKQPFGSGATCSYNYIDLRCKNETVFPFQINCRVTATHLEGSIRSDTAPIYDYTVYENRHCIKLQPWGGYTRHNVLYIKVKRDGRLIDDQYLLQNLAIMMYQPFIKGACASDAVV